ncbi:hypothetical protein C8R46DRAFT_1030234 [Mycena filopes]|nr:hypothetical protein C8R46DRAFT_1030234 [Mycena filopes]
MDGGPGSTFDFGIVPRLALHVEVAIASLNCHTYDARWEELLATIDTLYLFQLALRSLPMFRLVTTFVQQRQAPSSHAHAYIVGQTGDLLSGLPCEVLALILSNTTLAARTNLGRTSRKLRALSHRELQDGVGRILRRFRLCHADIRLMQVATGAVVGGDAVTSLLNYDFTPRWLDVYSPLSSADAVVRFFKLARADLETAKGECTLGGVLDCTRFFSSPSKDVVRVFRSRTENALDCTTYLPLTHLFGAITAHGIWLGYPVSALEGETFFNRDNLLMTSVAHAASALEVIRTYLHDYHYRFSLNRTHSCGRAWDCPCTPRTTDDAGCLRLLFPGKTFGALSAAVVYPRQGALSWSLYAPPCAGGMGPGTRVKDDDYKRWSGHMLDILTLLKYKLFTLLVHLRSLQRYFVHARRDDVYAQGAPTCPSCEVVVSAAPIRDNGLEMALAHAISEQKVLKSGAQPGVKVAASDSEYIWDGVKFSLDN